MIARTLVNGKEQVTVRCVNFLNDPNKIWYPGTNIAEFSPVQVMREPETPELASPRNIPKHLTELYERSSAAMSPTQIKQIAYLLRKYWDRFSSSDSDLGRMKIIKHRIRTGNASPIKQNMQEEFNKQLDIMLENDISQPSKSPWASGIILVEKRWNQTIHYRIQAYKRCDSQGCISFTENRRITGPACWLEVFISRIECRILASGR